MDKRKFGETICPFMSARIVVPANLPGMIAKPGQQELVPVMMPCSGPQCACARLDVQGIFAGCGLMVGGDWGDQ